MIGPRCRYGLSLVLATLLAACGGGSSAPSPAAPTPPAPSALSYGPAQTFVVGTAIAALTPTVTGTVGSYGVAPPLPGGLALNTTTGAIAGTPTAAAAAVNYTITASNSTGSTTAVLSITVNDRAPAATYSPTNVLTTGVPATLTPVSTGGSVTSWATTTALPAGLSIDASTGVIQGTPTAVSPAANYQVVASNSGGQITASLSIAVQSGVLLELGHAEEIDVLRIAGGKVLSRDTSGHWALWNLASAAQLAEGESPRGAPFCCAFPVDLAGNTLVTGVAGGFQIRDAADGHVLIFVEGSYDWWQLARDGSYVAAGNSTELRVWSRTGTELVNRTGDYHLANAFAAPGALRLVGGPAGADVVQTINPATGGATAGTPFLGTFNNWFADGESFLTTTGAGMSTTVRVYTHQAVHRDIASLPNVEGLAGYGNYFWTDGGLPRAVRVYRVGASSSPAATYMAESVIDSSGSELAVGIGTNAVGRVDLSGSAPLRTNFTIQSDNPTSFTIDQSGNWLVGARFGELTDETAPGTPRPFTYGRANAIAGSTPRVAIATASGRILYYNVATRTLEGSFAFPNSAYADISGDLALSADGSVLAAGVFSDQSTDRSVKTIALPAGVSSFTWVYASTAAYPQRIALSSSGTVLAQEMFDFSLNTIARQAGPANGGSPVYTASAPCPRLTDCPRIFLSPDGTYVALANGNDPITTGTNLYANGMLAQAVPGSVIGWQTNDLVLTNIYGHPPGVFGFGVVETRLYDRSSGQLRRSFVPPLQVERSRVQAVGAESLYLVQTNAIYSTVSGAFEWGSANTSRGVGAVAGGYVVFASGADVRIEPR